MYDGNLLTHKPRCKKPTKCLCHDTDIHVSLYHNINITYKKRYGNVSIIVYFKILAYMFVRKLCM